MTQQEQTGNRNRSRIALLQHAGSGNHGCEAIVDSLVRMLPEEQFLLLTNSQAEDEQYLPAAVKERVSIEEEQHIGAHPVKHALLYAWRKATGDRESFLRYRFRALTGRDHPRLAVCIGGDNYCYPEMVEDLILTDSMLHRQGTRTVLLGCSVEPSMLKRADVVKDMCSHTLITARESITYQALLDAGVPPEKVILCPDPAFTLPQAVPASIAAQRAGAVPGQGSSFLPEGRMSDGNHADSVEQNSSDTPVDGTTHRNEPKGSDMIGLNLSPMAENYSSHGALVRSACSSLIRHILDTSDASVALIPHVVWERSDDRVPLRALYEEFRATGRVILIPDQPAEGLKAVIARCRFFIGARTHATIAAYSSGVPTLVLGYSVKAKGIARDLFGTEEHYVLPVQQLSDPVQLIDGFEWLRAHESEVRQRLSSTMPQFCRRALENAEAVRRAMNMAEN